MVKGFTSYPEQSELWAGKYQPESFRSSSLVESACSSLLDLASRRLQRPVCFGKSGCLKVAAKLGFLVAMFGENSSVFCGKYHFV